MISLLKRSAIALSIFCCYAAAANNQVQLPTTEVDGKQYYYYDVQPKETVFSIGQRLGLSRQQIIDANPAVADGLQAYTRLYFPIEMGEIKATEAPVPGTTHQVAKGETLYGISRQYGLSVDRLIELNPSARDGVKQGEVLVISAEEKPAAPQNSSTRAESKHIIAQGETLYRIAADNGLTVEELLTANPTLDAFNYSAGTEIIIPGKRVATAPASKESTPQVTINEPSAGNDVAEAPVTHAPQRQQIQQGSQSQQPQQASDKLPPIVVEEPAPEGPDSFDIAVMLPFMLSSDTPDRAAKLYTDFYRGFLLAAKEQNTSGKPIRIHAFDTAANLDTISSLLSQPVMKEMELIIGPENESALNAVINGVDEETTFVFNPFVVRNTSYTDHPNVIQPNIPQEMMFAKAADAFVEQLEGRTPVFFARIKGQAEKDGFTTVFKQRLKDREIPYKELTFTDVLEKSDLSSLDSLGAYAFVPVSGQRAEFLKFKDALKDFGSSNPNGITLLGYPDWVTFRADLLEDLATLNAVIYTRFYNDPTYYRTREVADKFKNWYGAEMIDGAPLQAMLGYDTGMFVISAMRNNNGDFHLRPYNYEGLQNSFILEDSDVEGLVNTSLLMIKFKPGGLVERIKL